MAEISIDPPTLEVIKEYSCMDTRHEDEMCWAESFDRLTLGKLADYVDEQDVGNGESRDTCRLDQWQGMMV